jgi:hypothetical protein
VQSAQLLEEAELEDAIRMQDHAHTILAIEGLLEAVVAGALGVALVEEGFVGVVDPDLGQARDQQGSEGEA